MVLEFGRMKSTLLSSETLLVIDAACEFFFTY